MRSAALFAILWLAGAAAPLHRYQATRLSMACVYAIEAYGPDAAALPQVVSGRWVAARAMLGNVPLMRSTLFSSTLTQWQTLTLRTNGKHGAR